MSDNNESLQLNVKIPKRVLHFSDGVVEEFDDEEEETKPDDTNKQIVLENWPIVSSTVNNVVWFGSKTLEVCDYIGGGLANFFGITSPKYEYEIEEYKRRIEEQNRTEQKLKEEFAGWTQSEVKQTAINLTDIKSDIKSKDSELKEKQKY